MPAVLLDAKESVLEVLRKRTLGPAELMILVQRATQLDDITIKDAVSELLDQRLIEFSPGRKLRLRAGVRTAAS